ncbi:class I SAM-dependent methyltransferase [Nonomuraea turcica]|uniref:class I SAM-dependent methyltransferase n=1 Tax=Nonomuraea sp. G32 TaxID=3067274 RepID=UPI00273BFF52|nr:class I SAM-dependent methyltransferase [Nonomuraea sp. G32]MDP4501783.1 methyltransferase domain-containing protein [Nonomuraea sp. G32]
MQIVNTHQAEAWNAYEGEHWARNHDRYDAVNSGFNDLLLDAAGIGERDRVLDIGCGNGQVTRLAARRARLGHALGVDLSMPMLATARGLAAAEDISNVTFEQGDVQVHPFPDAGLDVAMSRFAVMFFADPIAAFTNVHRALRPGGRLAFLSMTDPTGTDLGEVLAALAGYLPQGRTAGDHGGGPLSLSDPEHITTLLTAAGFCEIAVSLVEAESIWGSDTADAAKFLMGWGPVRFNLGSADRAPARAALEAAFGRFERADAVRLRATAWLVTGAR